MEINLIYINQLFLSHDNDILNLTHVLSKLQQVVLLTAQCIPQISTPVNIRQQATPLQQQTQPISFASSNEKMIYPSSPQLITIPELQNKLPVPYHHNNLPKQIPNQQISGGVSYWYLCPITISGNESV